MAMKTITIRIDDELDERLEHLAHATHRAKTFYVREALLEHLEDLEDIFLAESRLEDFRAGRAKTIPLEEVMRSYDLEN